jgi:hypothetical protein
VTDQADDQGADQGADQSEGFRQLRKRAQRADALEQENRRLRTEMALRDAGLKLNDDQRHALLSVHDGDIDADAFRATAERLAFVDPQQVPADEQAAHARMAEATAAAMPSEAYPRTLTDELNEARSSEQLEAILAREGMLRIDG